MKKLKLLYLFMPIFCISSAIGITACFPPSLYQETLSDAFFGDENHEKINFYHPLSYAYSPNDLMNLLRQWVQTMAPKKNWFYPDDLTITPDTPDDSDIVGEHAAILSVSKASKHYIENSKLNFNYEIKHYQINNFDGYISGVFQYAKDDNAKKITIQKDEQCSINYAADNLFIPKYVYFLENKYQVEIGSGAFSYDIYLTGSLTIENNISDIGEYAFCECHELTSVFIDGDVNIKHDSFYNCNDVKNINVGNNLFYLGLGGFQACTSLTSLSIGLNLQAPIEAGVFNICTSFNLIQASNIIPMSINSSSFFNCNKNGVIISRDDGNISAKWLCDQINKSGATGWHTNYEK